MNTDQEKTTRCKRCGMDVHDDEYHPYAACLMFTSALLSSDLNQSKKDVRDNLEEVLNSTAEMHDKNDTIKALKSRLERIETVISMSVELSNRCGYGTKQLSEALEIIRDIKSGSID